MRRAGRYRFVIGIFALGGLTLLAWMVVSREFSAPPVAEHPREAKPVLLAASEADTGTRITIDGVSLGSPADQGKLRGRVIDAETKAPVREFTVEFFGRPAAKPTPGARVFRASDGRFEWPDVPPDRWDLATTAAGYQRFEMNGVVIRKGEATEEIVLPLRRGFKVAGRVYDELTGVGIKSASVSFREAQISEFDRNWRRRPRVDTDGNGLFELDGVPAGRVTLSIGSTDHASRELNVTVGSSNLSLQIALTAGGTLAGQLTAADGVTPIAGSVGLALLDRGSASSHKTGSDGAFSYQHLPPGRYRLSGGTEGGHVERDVTLRANERVEGIVLALNSASAIRGMITGLTAEELATVGITSYRDDDLIAATDANIDARGAYVLWGLKPGRVRIGADVSGRRQLSRVVDVPTNGELTVDFHFTRGARLSGRITRDGKPLPGANLQPEPVREHDLFVYPMPTGPNGSYSIDDLPDGDYRLHVAGYRSPVVRVLGDTVFDVEVPAMAEFAGRITEDPSGVPIVGASVELWTADPGAKPIRRQDVANHFGRFALAGLQPGDYLLTVYKPDYEIFRERVSFAGSIADRAIRLQPSRGVQVRVRDASTGDPLRIVHARENIAAGRGSYFQLPLDEDGRAALPSGLAGSVITFSAIGFAPVDINPWNGQELDLQLQPRGR